MKRSLILGCTALVLSASLTSCYRSRSEMWEDSKTAGRYMGKGMRSFFGQHVDSREYAKMSDNWDGREGHFAASDSQGEFVPLGGAEGFQSLEAKDYPISKESPGDPGSPIPGVDGFYSPTGSLATLFNNIHFETDHYSVQGSESVANLREIASYMTSHQGTYVFVEGHADERGAAAYNLALAAKRANAVRNFLIENGVNPDQLFTISYGLERPISLSHDEAGWMANRRAQFRLYDRKG